MIYATDMFLFALLRRLFFPICQETFGSHRSWFMLFVGRRFRCNYLQYMDPLCKIFSRSFHQSQGNNCENELMAYYFSCDINKQTEIKWGGMREYYELGEVAAVSAIPDRAARVRAEGNTCARLRTAKCMWNA